MLSEKMKNHEKKVVGQFEKFHQVSYFEPKAQSCAAPVQNSKTIRVVKLMQLKCFLFSNYKNV